MAASDTLYQTVLGQMRPAMCPSGVRATTTTRLALLVSGLLMGQSVVSRQIVTALQSLEWGAQVQRGAIRRRVQRALGDPALQMAAGYGAALHSIVPWARVRARCQAVVVILDDTSQRDQVHELRLALAYCGTAVPLAWRTWSQNTAQPAGAYWQAVEEVLRQGAEIIPPDLSVIVLADRAFDVPGFIDRVEARGWHWIVRAKIRGATHFRDARGDRTISDRVHHQLGHDRGARWRSAGHVFKRAGWRPASLVMVRGTDGPLALLSDLPPRWSLLALYRQRFWIETSFRNAKALGWRWESVQIADPAEHAVLLLAMAWATLITLSLGAAAAEDALLTLTSTAAPEHARESLFTMGCRRLQHALRTNGLQVLPWLLPHVLASTWDATWRATQARLHVFGVKTVTP